MADTGLMTASSIAPDPADVPPGSDTLPDLASGALPPDGVAALAERAVREATEAGLTPAELRVLLAGASVIEVVPPWPGESHAAYADRATSELLTRYLAQGVGDPPAAG